MVLELATAFPSEKSTASDFIKEVASKFKEICAKTATAPTDDWASTYLKKIIKATADSPTV